MGKRKQSLAEMEPLEDENPENAETPEEESAEAAEAQPESGEAADEGVEDSELPEELEITDEELVRLVAGLLFASPEPLPPARIARLVDPRRQRVNADRVREALEKLSDQLEGSVLPVQVRMLAGGAQLLTDPEVAAEITRLFSSRKVERMTPAGLETLAVVAYRQPVTKGEIEAIRGVQAGPVLRNLVDRDLIKVTGRADQPGSPLQYGTTREFLERFGLNDLSELPRDPELLRE